MALDKISHVCYSDESNWNTGQYRSLGVVSIGAGDLACAEAELNKILKSSRVSEFKWSKVRNAKYRLAAQKMCSFAIENAIDSRLRVDVLTWDTKDSRHDVQGRDDIANLGRMYYHLFRNVLRKRWPNDAVWKLFPDEHTALDWMSLQDSLDNASTQMGFTSPTLFRDSNELEIWREYGPAIVQPVESDAKPLLQLADLFAGLAVFSNEKNAEYRRWLDASAPPSLFSLLDESREDFSISNSLANRFTLLSEFDKECKKLKLGVSLDRCNGLRTFDPYNPLNFWMYVPQRQNDVAPVRTASVEAR